MKMKKAAFLLFIVVLLLHVMCIGALAETKDRKMLSPAFDVIANGQKNVKSGLICEDVSFTLTDFKQYLGIAEFEYITLTEVPPETSGYLKVGSMTVTGGQKIDASLLPLMKFAPSSPETELTSFRFCGDGNTSGAELECTLRLIDKINYAPTVAKVHENRLNIEALSGKSVRSSLGATDPEGDEVFFEIVEYPSHGAVRLLDRENGEYVYTANADYNGEDGFSYVAVDEYGNYTGKARVTVSVKKDKSGVVLQDMNGSYDLSAATFLVSENIILPSVRGGELFFLPDLEVGRAEFTVMAMKSADILPSEDLSILSGIEDAGKIDSLSAGYIASALNSGYIRAEISDDGKRLLRADDPITKAEASEILSKICGYESVSEDLAVFSDIGLIDAGTLRCMSAMYEYGVIDLQKYVFSPNERITREKCARMLYKLRSVL